MEGGGWCRDRNTQWAVGGHWALEGVGDAAARQRAVQDPGERQSTGPVGRDEWMVQSSSFFGPFPILSNLVPTDSLSMTTAHLLSSSRRPGTEFFDKIRLLRVAVTTTGQAMDAKAFGGTGLVSCSCVRSCESANIGVPPFTKTLRAAAWPQSTLSGVRRAENATT